MVSTKKIQIIGNVFLPEVRTILNLADIAKLTTQKDLTIDIFSREG